MKSALKELKNKRVAVVMSAGYFGFFGHAGFAKALLQLGIQPVAWSGSSAGALVASAMAGKLEPEKLISLFSNIQKPDFWDPHWFDLAKGALRNTSAPTGILKGKKFESLCRNMLPVTDFKHLEHGLLVTATDLSQQKTVHITDGDIPSAVVASCAYPGMFQAKLRNGSLLWDGGIVDKAPLLATFNHFKPEAVVLHYLPSLDEVKLPTGAMAFAKGINTGFTIIRQSHLELQLEVLRAKNIPVHVVTSRLPRVSPTGLKNGPRAAQEAYENTLASFENPLHSVLN
jgi:NTE family protein